MPSARGNRVKIEYAPVMELVDMRDLGSRAFSVWVRVPSGAPNQYNPNLFPIGNEFGLFVLS